MKLDYCILPIAHPGECLFAAVRSNPWKCNRHDNRPCPDCQTIGSHYCPMDVGRGDESETTVIDPEE